MAGGMTQQVRSVSWRSGVTEAGHRKLQAFTHAATEGSLGPLPHKATQASRVGLAQASRQVLSLGWPLAGFRPRMHQVLQASVRSDRAFFTPDT